MKYNIYPIQDSTIYDKYPLMNTGIDSILEINKSIEVSGSNNISYNSRVLIKFDYNDLNDLISLGFTSSASDLATDKYLLKLFTVNSNDLPSPYTLQIGMISGSWTMGLGKYDYSPSLTEGVSWKYKYGLLSKISWATSSFVNSTGSWNLIPGGGNWYTSQSLLITQSFNYNQNSDLSINISNLVYNHINNTIPNDGFIIKRESSSEYTTTDYANLQYYSSDTNTIYLPYIQVNWNDWLFNTGSLTTVSSNEENVVYFTNLNSEYYNEELNRFRLVIRPKYPAKTFSTSSIYSSIYYLPPSSSYSVVDLYTKQTVIENDNTYTRISCDSTGSYFNFSMKGLQPERWYKFIIHVTYDNMYTKNYDNKFIFKVNRTE
jgi:hypothetical protein